MDELDQEIRFAYRHLIVSRAQFALNPSGEGVSACEQAEEELNGLLERRYTLTHLAVAVAAVAA